MHFKTNLLKFTLKLLVDQNIVLVEYPGREPQLFMPALLDDTIVLQNIVFDYEAPMPVKRKEKLPNRSAKTPAKKMTVPIEVEQDQVKPKLCETRLNSGTVIKDSSFQWVRSGSKTNQKWSRKLLCLEKPIAPVLDPAIVPSASAVPLGPSYSKTTPRFDVIRKIYLNNNHKAVRCSPTVKKEFKGSRTKLSRKQALAKKNCI